VEDCLQKMAEAVGPVVHLCRYCTILSNFKVSTERGRDDVKTTL
jgi:hypothetical protein